MIKALIVALAVCAFVVSPTKAQTPPDNPACFFPTPAPTPRNYLTPMPILRIPEGWYDQCASECYYTPTPAALLPTMPITPLEIITMTVTPTPIVTGTATATPTPTPGATPTPGIIPRMSVDDVEIFSTPIIGQYARCIINCFAPGLTYYMLLENVNPPSSTSSTIRWSEIFLEIYGGSGTAIPNNVVIRCTGDNCIFSERFYTDRTSIVVCRAFSKTVPISSCSVSAELAIPLVGGSNVVPLRMALRENQCYNSGVDDVLGKTCIGGAQITNTTWFFSPSPFPPPVPTSTPTPMPTATPTMTPTATPTPGLGTVLINMKNRNGDYVASNKIHCEIGGHQATHNKICFSCAELLCNFPVGQTSNIIASYASENLVFHDYSASPGAGFDQIMSTHFVRWNNPTSAIYTVTFIIEGGSPLGTLTPTPSPTPTPTPQIAHGCSTNWDDWPGYGDEETTPWNGIEYTDGGCMVLIPGGDVGEYFTLPGFQVCVTYVSLPSMQDFFPFLPDLPILALLAIPVGIWLLNLILSQWGG